MPARRVPPPPPTRQAVPAVDPGDQAEDGGDVDEPVAVVELLHPVRQGRNIIGEIRFMRRPTLRDMVGFPHGVAVGQTTHCAEMML